MKTDSEICNLQILWIAGCLERLATLGFFEEEVPYVLSSEAVDTYVKVDENRHSIITDDEVKEIIPVYVRITSDLPMKDDDIDIITELVLQYKNNRTEMVKHALVNHMTL
jgi:hypothetical protein